MKLSAPIPILRAPPVITDERLKLTIMCSYKAPPIKNNKGTMNNAVISSEYAISFESFSFFVLCSNNKRKGKQRIFGYVTSKEKPKSGAKSISFPLIITHMLNKTKKTCNVYISVTKELIHNNFEVANRIPENTLMK